MVGTSERFCFLGFFKNYDESISLDMNTMLPLVSVPTREVPVPTCYLDIGTGTYLSHLTTYEIFRMARSELWWGGQCRASSTRNRHTIATAMPLPVSLLAQLNALIENFLINEGNSN